VNEDPLASDELVFQVGERVASSEDLAYGHGIVVNIGTVPNSRHQIYRVRFYEPPQVDWPRYSVDSQHQPVIDDEPSAWEMDFRAHGLRKLSIVDQLADVAREEDLSE
jgi:hypothetical protein